ncbi:alpha/beta fold hydrolase [Agromyces soli]
MDVILIPGFWLGADSWRRVTPLLVEAGHRVHPLTLPGLESADADREGITLQDHIDFVARAIDGIAGPVALVGHSGGGPVAWGAADARVDRVSRVVFVDAGPLVSGESINAALPVVDGEVPLPAWSDFGDEDLVDLDDGLRAEFRAVAVPVPARVASDPLALHDERRYELPVTVIACEFPSSALAEWMAADAPFTRELARVRQRELIDLPTGHWPQFTKPVQLGQAISAALRPS